MPTHRVNRTEIELGITRVELGEPLSARLSRLHERRIAPLLDRVCGELSGPERVDRIDKLQLDLGSIPLAGFDDELIVRLETALRAALGQELRADRADKPPGQTSIDLLECYARTGNLPWWADRSAAEPVAHHLRELLGSSPGAWVGLLGALAGDTVALARLARRCEGALFEAIVERCGGAESITDLRELERLLAQASEPIWAVRALVLQELSRQGRRLPTTMLHTLLQQLDPRVLAELAGAELRSPATERVRAAIEQVVAHAPGTAAAQRPSASDEIRVTAESSASGEKRGGIEESSNASGPHAARGSLGVNGSRAGEVSGSSDDSPTAQRASVTGDTGPANEATPARNAHVSGDSQTVSQSRELPFSPRGAARDRPAAGLPHNDPRAALARRRGLEGLDELYVEDAGLVILWPFLERFFLRSGMLVPKRHFVDELAQMQAIALLAQSAFEDPEPPEYLLPLAKLLCGVAPEAPFVPESRPAPEQLEECERLLGAAIAHAPILGDMPIPVFRATFLQRTGALSIRAGAWLLQVERQTHDVILERFSWSWAWVKLPWMPDPLQVEW